MNQFWEEKFKLEQTSWGFEPSDSAILAHDFFLQQHITDLLIPGFGYGRNAKLFHQSGFKVTGIEISKEAILLAREQNALDCTIYHGSVTDMPFDNLHYEGIFCYALIHLLNQRDRKQFLEHCFAQLKTGGYMFFTVISKKSVMYGKGKILSRGRYELLKGLNVFFYDTESVQKEFGAFGLLESKEIDEPIKHMPNEPPMQCILVKCKK